MTEGKNIPNSSADVPFRHHRKTSLINPGLVGVIDEGTSAVRFSIYTTPDFKEIATHRESIEQISPQNGWYEENPMQIMTTINQCAKEAIEQLPALGFNITDIVTIGITNQRETTVVWDAETGQPLYNALVWKDIRSSITVNQVLAKVPEQNQNYFKSTTGLPISPIFSAPKIRWLKDNVAAVRKACREHRCKAGTVDSWIIWNLTKGTTHVTDVTNASRTLLMNIETLDWDPVLLKTFSIHVKMLPEIRSCSEIYGTVTDEKSVLYGIPISAIIGNQQASLLGQMCLKPGQAKNTYRSGCFVLCNIGEKRVISTHGLLTTIAYKLGPTAPPCYALEGAVAVAGHALRWLQSGFRIMDNFTQAEKHAEAVPTTGGVYFVPAFTGLYAPYWREDARGIICGLTQFSTKDHIVRATLEAICFQTRDILECMYMEGGFELSKLYVDGTLTTNDLLMQLQSDIAGVPVFRSQMLDTTPFGAAMCAAQARGIDLCRFEPERRYYENISYDTFLPTSTDTERQLRYGKWKRAVQRSLGWAIKPKSTKMTEERYRLLASVPVGLFFIVSFGFLAHSMRALK